jgi:hypothetical protein
MPEDFAVPAEGDDVYRCFVMPTGLAESRSITAIEVRPGNPRVVHHTFAYVDVRGLGRDRDRDDPGPGYMCFSGFTGDRIFGALGGWTPGNEPHFYGEGIGQHLPPGADVVMQVHYHPSGKPERDQSSLALYFTKERPTRHLLPLVLGSHRIDIAPGDQDYVVKDSAVLPAAVSLIGLTPHAHLLAKDLKADAYLPDGTVEHLIWIRDWDFNWQEQYRYAVPVRLPAGTRVEMVYRYDNSAGNPRNPNVPPKRVRFGEQTEDEMALLFMNVIPDRLIDIPALLKAAFSRRREVGGDQPGP